MLFTGLELRHLASGTIYRYVASGADSEFVRVVDAEEPYRSRVESVKGKILGVLHRHQVETLGQPGPSSALRDPQIDI